MDTFKNRPAYGWGEFTSEVFGSLSFILGIAFVALIDWILAILLWLCGKLPYIPAMPPIINSDLYVRDIYYHIRHELCGDPIPMTISQTYLKAHEQRRDAFKAVVSTTKKPADGRQRFPRLRQRKSSFAIMSETIAAASHHHGEKHLQEQFKSLSEAISRHGISTGSFAQRRPADARDVPSHPHMFPSTVQPPKATGVSTHGMPTSTEHSEPKITISAPDEEADDTRQEDQKGDAEQKVQKADAGQEVHKADAGAPSAGADDTGQVRQAVDPSSLPEIERQRRPSRAASVLRDLEEAGASRSAEAEDRVPPAMAPPSVQQERRRSSIYRTKPRRKSHAVAPAPAPQEHDEDDEPPD